ncbi:uncharacterized protein CIMG_13334 [Coccidioides immitis RS]|uniref:Stress-associated endoplasmic reticulum protein n=1 Tax=Coccidioides immitis (strain RS) TaxID=246410 RepID=A0A0D8JUB4_COCIM|nr:uncharacterized protein CIMG_13334 [Coccidioides immitis RS]KJF60940.1 hypothetical protein CIMG_13334 [Coccidioides immitis RS]QVM13738.1 hypothetical protein D8B26_008344 [Coccidioides posadasii str. Silveira]TPX23097.1 hypothetical protein DIZ76_014979 [Coccidioides immitis]
MAQTPQQRRANERYAKNETAKRGKPENISKAKIKPKASLSTGWVVVLAFVVCGGVMFELVRVIPELWGLISSLISRWTS